jgi:hypothetical protein
MGALFRGFVKKLSFFHCLSALHPGENLSLGTPALFRSGGIYSILILAMTKRKPGKFSVTKAVKANARERVGPRG